MDDTKIPFIELFLKASPSKPSEKSPCLIGQQWFMTLYLLVEKGLINLKVTPTKPENPPSEYSQLNVARHLPVAHVISGSIDNTDVSGAIISSEKSLEALMFDLGCPYLTDSVQGDKCLAVERVFADLYRNFLFYIRRGSFQQLESSLLLLEHHMRKNSSAYLIGPNMTYADCQLMPKLQHLRVIGRAYKNFDIPPTLVNVWCYIRRMYQCQAFITSCPLDRDLLMHYNSKFDLTLKFKPSLLGDIATNDIPETIEQLCT